MTFVRYVANPPQHARDGVVNDQAGYAFQVGDRISVSDSIGATALITYRCTTAGISGPGSAYQYMATPTFTWGTSVWTQIDTSVGWDNAATMPDRAYSNGPAINYIDFRFNGNSFYTPTWPAGTVIYVYVDPATMKPTNALYPIQHNMAAVSAPMFFGVGQGYYAEPSLPSGVLNPAQSPGPFLVDSKMTTNTTVPIRSFSWGAEIEVAGTSGIPTITSDTVGVTVTKAAGVGTHSNLQTATLQDRTFAIWKQQAYTDAGGFTVNTNSSDLTTDWTNIRYQTHGGTRRESRIVGHMCTLYESFNCYRTGAFQSWETPHSIQILTAYTPRQGFPVQTPHFQIQQTLTGARTVRLHFYTDCPIPLTNLDCWIDVFYNDSATTQRYGVVTSMNANYGAPWATGAAITAGAAWTEVTGVYLGTSYRIDVPLTIQRATPLLIRMTVATDKVKGFFIYIDPNIEVV